MTRDRDLDRRRFLALMSASAALAAAGCGKFGDRGDIVPYLRQPDGAIPGLPRYYASMLRGTPGAPPVVVTTREGRAVKLEGNPEHPASRGALGAFGQAATWSLYDPDRLRAPRDRHGATTWRAVDATLRGALVEATSRGAGIVLFTPALVSPTERALVDEFRAAYPTTRAVPLETFDDSQAIEGWRAATGLDAGPAIEWSTVDVIVGFEADFLDRDAADARAWFEHRQPDAGRMSRLWAIEGAPTLTGTNADHRLAVCPSMQARLLLAVLRELVVNLGLGPFARDQEVCRAVAPFGLDREARAAGVDSHVVAALVTELVTHRGRCAVVVGPLLPPAMHVLAAAINGTLGNIGTTVRARRAAAPRVAAEREIDDAIAAMESRAVAVAIDLDANARYALGWRRGFDRALANVPLVVSGSLVLNETGAGASFAMPTTHDLEAWGDADLHEDVLTLQQPAMQPLFGARQREDLLLAWLPSAPGRPGNFRDYLRRRYEQQVYRSLDIPVGFATFWRGALQDGFIRVPVASTERHAATSAPVAGAAIVAAVARLTSLPPSGSEVILAPSPHVYDGRFANNGWLQELPHPVTTHVWGNAAIVGVAAASRLGCTDGDLLSVQVGGRTVSLPALVEPGVAPDVVRIELGHGRSAAGRIGTGVGVDASLLRGTAENGQNRFSPWICTGAIVARTPGRAAVVRAQRYPRSEKRPLAVEATLADYVADRGFVHEQIRHGGNVPSPGGWTYATGQKWVMVVDLSRCSGCNACVAACSAENNVPVVGIDQVRRERQMHWIRVDRYYDSRADTARVTRQPVLCQQCDNAPCENVCPVAATVHSADGLNQMTYNRCVGTRYCANNCPYKVRRFNFLDYHATLGTPEELRMSPEVTVRSRGVMEKCTFCVQRLRAAQRVARREGRPLVDGEARPACEQTCPAGAIAFGDLNDPHSRVRGLVENARGYRLLGELGTNPSVIYLAKIRHPHPGVDA